MHLIRRYGLAVGCAIAGVFAASLVTDLGVSPWLVIASACILLIAVWIFSLFWASKKTGRTPEP